MFNIVYRESSKYDYILSSDCSKDFSPFIGLELSVSRFTYRVVGVIENVGTHETSKNENAVYITPMLGISIPFVYNFVLRSTAKFKMPLFYLKRFDNYPYIYNNQFAFNFGIMYTL